MKIQFSCEMFGKKSFTKNANSFCSCEQISNILGFRQREFQKLFLACEPN